MDNQDLFVSKIKIPNGDILNLKTGEQVLLEQLSKELTDLQEEVKTII